jgi:hypothetical protein
MKSSMHSLPPSNTKKNIAFHTQYADGERVLEGRHAMDAMTLGDYITIPNQIFAQVALLDIFKRVKANKVFWA